MVPSMRDIGKKESIMERVFIKLQEEQNMMENGLQVVITVLELLFGLMEVSLRENGRIVGKMERESFKE